ncbi:MAG: nuclear transport factor 2 family protein [Planctomycetota bacterium]
MKADWFRRLGWATATCAAVIIVASATSTTSRASTQASATEQAVSQVIHKAYFNGAFNDQDTVAMADGFHKDFAIFSARGEELGRYEIATWIDGIKKRRAASDFDASSTRYNGSIVALDVTGGAASAKIELRRGGYLVYTDYLSLLKFDSGWKIVAKVYHKHG